MATATVNKGAAMMAAKRRFKIWMTFIILFMGWAGYTLFGQLQQQNATHQKLSGIQEQLELTRQESEALRLEVDKLNDPEYISQLATKEQGMVKEGEQQIFSE